jgi:glyoxylase-like metal-dependent hydrolase (beta-lactamase superfamily II)
MIEQVATDLYKVEVPLPDNLLRSVNAYIVKASERDLIIDPGMNREECLNVMQTSLKELKVDLGKTDFFITHSHVDHFSLVLSLATEESTIYFNRPDMGIVDRIRRGTFLEDATHLTFLNGFPEMALKEIFDPGADGYYRYDRDLPFKMVEDGDIINTGDYVFRCLRTSGHTEGHTCLFEPHQKILISGDHLLGDITPSIQLRSGEGNPLEKYLESLNRVYDLDIALVLPGHRGVFSRCKERIAELKKHHQERADQVISILKKGSQNAYQVASQMTWDTNCDSWDFFPVLHRWFATGEAAAHLRYLEGKGTVQKEIKEQKIVYSLNSIL